MAKLRVFRKYIKNAYTCTFFSVTSMPNIKVIGLATRALIDRQVDGQTNKHTGAKILPLSLNSGGGKIPYLQ